VSSKGPNTTPKKSRQDPARHVGLAARRIHVHQRGLEETDEGSRSRVKRNKGQKQDGEAPREPGHGESETEHDAAANDD
jgi:hypothetical protein